MIQAVLSNKQHSEYGVATVPFPIGKDEYDHILALLEPLGIGDAVKQDCHIEELRGDFPALKQMEMTNANLDELDYLAKRLDSFDEYEKAQFQGMASCMELHSVEELINLTFCCQEVTVVTDFKDLATLGRRHFLTMNGGAASPEEMQGKDFGKIALDLLDQQVGRVTHYGVVYDNDFEMTELYDGRRFPEYHYEDCVMEVEMSLRFAPVDSPAAYLYLPMSQSQIERAMLRAGIDSYGDMSLRFMESELPEEIDATLDFENENLPDLNELCRAVAPLSSLECAMLGAAVLLARPECAAQVRQLAENLDQFDFVLGVHSPKEYGEYMIKESEHFQYDENLAEFYDFEKYGRQRVEQEGGVFNQRGYIAYQGTLSLDELMQGDPAENMSPQNGRDGMITISLAYVGVDEGFRLRFPFSTTENSKTLLEVLYQNPRVDKIEIAEVSSNVYNLGGYLKNVDIWNPDNREKLETLGRTLQTMDRDSCLKFEGVLDANSVNGLNDVLRLSEALDEYILLPDTGGGSALGKYLVTHGITPFPESVQPYLDYQIIGAEFYADHGGAFCRAGYVVRKEELPQQFLQTGQEQKSVMLLRLRASHGKQQNPIFTTLALPAADELLERARQRLGIEDFAEAEITMVDYIFPYFATMVPQDCITVESANALAQAIVQMNQTDGELLKYLAAVELEQPDTFDGALQIARNIGNYEMIPSSQADDGFHTQFGQIRRLDAPIETQGMGGMELC